MMHGSVSVQWATQQNDCIHGHNVALSHSAVGCLWAVGRADESRNEGSMRQNRSAWPFREGLAAASMLFTVQE